MKSLLYWWLLAVAGVWCSAPKSLQTAETRLDLQTILTSMGDESIQPEWIYTHIVVVGVREWFMEQEWQVQYQPTTLALWVSHLPLTKVIYTHSGDCATNMHLLHDQFHRQERIVRINNDIVALQENQLLDPFVREIIKQKLSWEMSLQEVDDLEAFIRIHCLEKPSTQQ